MTGFTLHLQGTLRTQELGAVTSFVGEDESGQFGLLASHERFVTVLLPGLARYRVRDEPWTWLALPGGTLDFRGGELFISTTQYLAGPDFREMSSALRDDLLRKEQSAAALKTSVQRLETEMLKRLYEFQRRSDRP
jgi:F-type H+-transporting ATPase subunit epsilon